MTENTEQWARVRRLEGGDDMHASSLTCHSEDRRDATYVRVSRLPSSALEYITYLMIALLKV